MWLQIRKNNPVIYFDSSGSILHKVENQKQIYLYSLVAYDFTTRVIIPIAEFHTTSHTASSISGYLFQIKEIFNESNGDDETYNIFPVVVMDQSFALMISILKIFNNCELIEYINWCYKVLFNENYEIQSNQSMKTLVGSFKFLDKRTFFKSIEAADLLLSLNSFLFI